MSTTPGSLNDGVVDRLVLDVWVSTMPVNAWDEDERVVWVVVAG